MRKIGHRNRGTTFGLALMLLLCAASAKAVSGQEVPIRISIPKQSDYSKTNSARTDAQRMGRTESSPQGPILPANPAGKSTWKPAGISRTPAHRDLSTPSRETRPVAPVVGENVGVEPGRLPETGEKKLLLPELHLAPLPPPKSETLEPVPTLPTVQQMATERIEETRRTIRTSNDNTSRPSSDFAKQTPPSREIQTSVRVSPVSQRAARPVKPATSTGTSPGRAPLRREPASTNKEQSAGVEPVWFISQQEKASKPTQSAPPGVDLSLPAEVENLAPTPAPGGIMDRKANPPPALPPKPDIPGRVQIPLARPDLEGQVQWNSGSDRVSLVVQDKPLGAVLHTLAGLKGVNIAANLDTDTAISVTLNDVGFEEALSAIVSIAGCTWVRNGDIILVSKLSAETRTSPQVQGRRVQVFPLNYVDASDIEAVAKGLLSPVGQIFTTKTLTTDRKKTQELVVVEDVPGSLARVADYIAQVDCPPRQVMIEAHVLQVELKDAMRHGVNWQYLTTISGRELALKTQGFANPLATPGSVFSLDGDKLDILLELLQSTAETKTLASPKVVVANGQEAKIQIGAKFGYFVTTTTQTSTMQNVNFLETGVILTVTPQVSLDGQVLMTVKPEVSTGRISPAGLPETETTTAQTTVMLPDGGGMVIGGLIKELDTETQDKVPILGDLKVVGRLFQRRVVTRQRNEIIIALVPRIVPYQPDYQSVHDADLSRATTPILSGGLKRVHRPADGTLPDAIENPRHFRLNRLPDAVDSINEPFPYPLEHYFPAISDEHPDWYGPTHPLPVPSYAAPNHPAHFDVGTAEQPARR